MMLRDSVLYADNPIAALPEVAALRVLPDHKLWLRFTDGAEGVFDCRRLLDRPAFRPLQNEEVFRGAYVDYGTVCWQDGEIDIDPEWLREDLLSMEA